MSSYVLLRASVVECWLILLIDILNQYRDWCSVDTLNTLRLHQQKADSWLSVGQLIWIIDWKLVASRTTVDWDVNGMSIECQPRCWRSIDQGSIKSINRHSTSNAWSTRIDPRNVTYTSELSIAYLETSTNISKNIFNRNRSIIKMKFTGWKQLEHIFEYGTCTKYVNLSVCITDLHARLPQTSVFKITEWLLIKSKIKVSFRTR